MQIDGVSFERNDHGGNTKMTRFFKLGAYSISVFSIIVVVLGIAVVFWGEKIPLKYRFVNTNSWYAVYLNDNQVYFGHIKNLSNSTILLYDAYSLKPVEMPEGKSATSSDFSVESLKKWYTLVPLRNNTLEVSNSEIVFLSKIDERVGIISIINQSRDKNE